jgi:hypothetical protein
MTIKITRAEGGEAYAERTTFADMDVLLYNWGRTAPERGSGYDKCDVVVEFSPEDSVTFRYDLTRGGGEDYHHAHFRGTLRDHLRFHAGEYCPPHLSELSYKGIMEMFREGRPRYKELLERYLHLIDNHG